MQHQSTPAKLGQGSVQSDPLTWSECELIVAFYAAGVERRGAPGKGSV